MRHRHLSMPFRLSARPVFIRGSFTHARFLQFAPAPRIGYLQQSSVISIVDDDESIRVATMRLLRLHGFVVHTFVSAEAFLQSPLVNGTSCLIADVQMPGMNGIELQERLVQQGHNTPVIFITAFPEERHRTRAMEAGAVSFLRKPFDAQSLIDCIDEALKRRGDGPVRG